MTLADLMGRNTGTLTNMSGTVSGIRGTTRAGGRGQVSFDGTDDYITAGADTSLDMAGSFTLGAWVRIDAFSSNYKLVMAKGTTSRNYSFGVDAGAGNRGLFIGIAGVGSIGAGGDITVPVAQTMAAGVWYRYVVVYNGPTTLNVYQNAVSVYSTGGLSGSAPTTNSDPLVFGQGTGGFGYHNGAMDDWFISSRAWGVADVWADYALGRSGYPGVLPEVFNMSAMAPPTAAAAALFRRSLSLRAGSRGSP